MLTPISLDGSGVASCDTGDHHSIVLTRAGNLFVAGKNDNGQVGVKLKTKNTLKNDNNKVQLSTISHNFNGQDGEEVGLNGDDVCDEDDDFEHVRVWQKITPNVSGVIEQVFGTCGHSFLIVRRENKLLKQKMFQMAQKHVYCNVKIEFKS